MGSIRREELKKWTLDLRNGPSHGVVTDVIFDNLHSDELNKAVWWCGHLENAEQKRVAETLKAINGTSFFINEMMACPEGIGVKSVRKDIPMATIVAGSSVEGVTGAYPDIDFFLLSKDSLYSKGKLRNNPKKTLIKQLEWKLPPYSYGIVYGNKNHNMVLMDEVNPKDLGLGARVTVSVFHELEGFDRRRIGKLNDLIEFVDVSGAEEMILYNRDRGSKFLVLSRQYPVS